MSKSIGNIVSILDLGKKYNGQIIRLALLSSHYRQPLDWNEKLINESKKILNKWYSQYEKTDSYELEEDIAKSLLDDLNTPEYITKLHSLYEESFKGNKTSKVKFNKACNFIGLLNEDKKTWDDFNKNIFGDKFIEERIQDRKNARKRGDYKLADAIRKELDDKGVVIEDKEDQTTWKYK
jgi:cysteinyl-tRNA synthetase